MSPRGELRFLPSDTNELELSHPGYDTERATQDPDVVFPLATMRRLAADRVIGSLAPSAVSTMGFIPRGERIVNDLVPEVVDYLRNEQVDLALLVPA